MSSPVPTIAERDPLPDPQNVSGWVIEYGHVAGTGTFMTLLHWAFTHDSRWPRRSRRERSVSAWSPFNVFNKASVPVLANECTDRKLPRYQVKGRYTMHGGRHVWRQCPRRHFTISGQGVHRESRASHLLNSQAALHPEDMIIRPLSWSAHHSIGLETGSKGARNDQRAISDRKHRGDMTNKASGPSVLQDVAQPIERSCLYPVILSWSMTKAGLEANTHELWRRVHRWSYAAPGATLGNRTLGLPTSPGKNHAG